jgi:hypothetical protein
MKKSLLLLAVCLTIAMAACTAKNTTNTGTEKSGIAATESSDPSDGSPEARSSAEKEESTGGKTEPAATDSGSVAPATPGGNGATESTTKPTKPPAASSQVPAQPTTTSRPAAASSASPPSASRPVYTEADYADIIRQVRTYAESKTTVRFIWTPSLQMNGTVGYHGTPDLNKSGKDSVVRTLKYHADLTEEMILGQVGNEVVDITYHVIWFVDTHNIWGDSNGDICFALLYG